MKEGKEINLQLSVMKAFKHCRTNIIATDSYVEGPLLQEEPKKSHYLEFFQTL